MADFPEHNYPIFSVIKIEVFPVQMRLAALM